MHPRAAPAVVVVMGPAGAGKTTVGLALAEALGWRFRDADDFHAPESVARMRRGEALTDAHRTPWLDALRARVGDDVAEAARGGAGAVLACSALRRAYRDALVPAAAPAGAVRFVYLRVSAAALAARLSSRVDHFAPAALLESQLATLEEPGTEEGALVVDGERPVAEVVAAVRRALGV
jgi:gluconokinase